MNNNKDQSRCNTRCRRFWVIGAGRFGQIAVNRIRQHIGGALITVVDETPPSESARVDHVVRADGVDWLARTLANDSPVEMVLPAIPVHVAAGWLKRKLADRYTVHPMDARDAWLAHMPNAIRGQAGQVFVSHADFICPDDCPEPATICTHTGQPRPMDLFRLLADVKIGGGLVPIVIRSRQLLPGVGGILPADLYAALEMAASHAGRPLMIATACRCHGVADFMRLDPVIE